VKEKLSVTDVFKALSDKRSLSLFNSISTNDADSQKLVIDSALSKRQYYDRINKLRTAGLVRRQKGTYKITSFGRVIQSLEKVAQKATENHWKLQAIDMMDFSAKMDSAGPDYMKIIDILVEDIEIKSILLEKYVPDINNKSHYSYARSDHIIQPIK
jgi:hypothetical protein